MCTNGEILPGSDDTWGQKSHVFILSISGKPVYSRHGSEDSLATLSGVMQLLVSFVQSSEDSIRRIKAGQTIIEFLVLEPIILVSVAREGQSGHELRGNLRHLHNLLLSILTSAQIQKIYKERKNFDLRRLLAGSERLIDHLLDNIPHEPGFFLEAVPCLHLESNIRSIIANAITQVCSKLKEVVFGVVVVHNRLVCRVRKDPYQLHPADMLLILNLVSSTESFKSGETWTPLCLPRFDSTGYLHAHVSYLSPECSACLLLLTVDKDIFYALSDSKQRLVEKLEKANIISAINESVKKPAPVTSSLGIPELRHFLNVVPETGTYFCPRFEAPYETAHARAGLIAAYRSLHEDVTTRGLKLLFVRRSCEALLAWTRNDIQLYLVFEPLVSREDAIRHVAKVLPWLTQHKSSLFMNEDFVL